MNRLIEAFRWFFAILLGSGLQDIRTLQAREKDSDEGSRDTTANVAEVRPDQHEQNGARLLLARLQDESRLVDFLMEDIAGFEDAQIGAAVRQVHAKAAEVLREGLGIQPMRSEGEGATVSVARSERADHNLVGHVGGSGDLTGTLRHHGWKATRTLTLPHAESVNVDIVAKAEVEVNG